MIYEYTCYIRLVIVFILFVYIAIWLFSLPFVPMIMSFGFGIGGPVFIIQKSVVQSITGLIS
jgi:hypothetical protein